MIYVANIPERRPNLLLGIQNGELKNTRRINFGDPKINALTEYASNWSEYVEFPFNKYSRRSRRIGEDTQLTGEYTPLTIDNKTGSILLPFPYATPTTKDGIYREFFYWDQLLTSLALLVQGTPEHIALAKAHVGNFEYELREVGFFVPNQSNITHTDRPQPPVLALIDAAIGEKTKDKKYLANHLPWAMGEYHTWMMTQKESNRERRRFPQARPNPNISLVRFSGRDIPGNTYASVAASGMDDTNEFAGDPARYYPMHLNALMYMYEKIFEQNALSFGVTKEADKWYRAAEKRKKEIIDFMWSPDKGYFFNHRMKPDGTYGEKDDTYYSLTAFTFMFAELVTPEQAAQMVEKLHKFETPFGLAVSSLAPEDGKSTPEDAEIERYITLLRSEGVAERYMPSLREVLAKKQWTKNIWPPFEYFAVRGLLNYGYIDEATRIMENTIRALSNYLDKNNTLPEKRNPQTGEHDGSYLYPEQKGFGWTKALVVLYSEILKQIYKGEDLTSQPSFINREEHSSKNNLVA